VGPHSHDCYECCYVFDGKVFNYINDNVVILRKGDFILMHPDISHSSFPDPHAAACNILIHADYAQELSKKLYEYDKDNFFSFVVNKKGYSVQHTENEEVERLISFIKDYPFIKLAKAPIDNLSLESSYNQAIALLVSEEYQNSALKVTTTHGASYKRKKDSEIIQYINDNYNHIDVNTVCQIYHYSRMQLYRLIKKNTGVSFIDYISNLRMLHAKRLLISSDLPVKQIAEHVGLEENYFYRFFRNYTNTTPYDYRKNYKNQTKL